MNQTIIDPGIAINVYFVQILVEKRVNESVCLTTYSICIVTYSVINAPFHKIQPNTAVNTAVPAHHWPPTWPFWNTPSVLKMPTPRKNKIYCQERKQKCINCVNQKSDSFHFWQQLRAHKLTKEWKTALPNQPQNFFWLKNSFVWPSIYIWGYLSNILADTNWSKIPIHKGGKKVKMTLKQDMVQDS